MKLLFNAFLFIMSCIFSVTAQEKEKKENKVNLDEIIVKTEKKAIIQKADRTIFNFDAQAYLNSGSLLDGIKKLPGLIVSDVAGLMYQGKMLQVYLDGRPLNISSNELNSFLESMPANNIERVEIITQPGAEYPATDGGAIINIITSKNAKKYISATYSSGVNFTNDDKFRTRFNTNILLTAKNNYFGWQLNLGQNYRENALWSSIIKTQYNTPTILSDTYADRISRAYFAKSALTFDLKKDRLIVNYDLTFNNNSSDITGSGLGFITNDFSRNKITKQDVVATYQKRFEKKDRELDFKFNFARNNNDFNLTSIPANNTILKNNSLQDYYNFKIDYKQDIRVLDKGKLSIGTAIDQLNFKTANAEITNLNYSRKTTAGYLELQTSLQKFDFIVGLRGENYLINGNTDNGKLIPFNQFRVFPNTAIQYNFTDQLLFNINYNKKISLPSTTLLNPNNTNYQNQNVNFSGNPQLDPTIFDNFEAKISAFGYFNISYNLNLSKNQIINRVFENDNVVTNTSINVAEVKIHNFNIGLPIPYILFTKGLKETLKFNFNPDKIDFIYAYAGYQIHQIPNFDTKGFWVYNLMSQIVFKNDIKFVTNYNVSSKGGNYYYFIINKPLRQSLDLTFSKKFLKDQLSVSLNFDNILNTNQNSYASSGTYLTLDSRNDYRRIGFNLSYKIPTRNKLAKEATNLLNTSKKEENQLLQD